MSHLFNFPTLRENVAHDLRSESGKEFTPLLPKKLQLLRKIVLNTIVVCCLCTGAMIYFAFTAYTKTSQIEDAITRENLEVSTLRNTVVAMNKDEDFAQKIAILKAQTLGVQPLSVNMLKECEQFGKVSEWDLKLINPLMNQFGLTLQFMVERGNALQLLDQIERTARSSGWQMTRGDPQYNDSGIQITLYFMPKGAA